MDHYLNYVYNQNHLYAAERSQIPFFKEYIKGLMLSEELWIVVVCLLTV